MGTNNGRRPEAIYVRLKPAELLNAAIIGAQRNIINIRKKRPGVYGIQDGYDWQAHIDGAIAEYVVAKELGVFWNGDVGILGAPDVGMGLSIEVRSTPSRNRRLIIHEEDKDGVAYVLVAGTGDERWIQGWAYAEDCKQERYWEDPSEKDRWAFFVPVEDLLKWSDLLVAMNIHH